MVPGRQEEEVNLPRDVEHGTNHHEILKVCPPEGIQGVFAQSLSYCR